MKIIDAHLHIFPDGGAAPAACQTENISALRRFWEPLEIIHGVVMGNRSAGTGPLPGTKLENFPQWQPGHAKFLTCLHPGAQKTSNRCKPIMAK